jgi:NDP-sugar pyrophosphorylase family protein
VKTVNVFVLAAGYGERLRPITDYIPKPLLPVLGKPVIERVIERFSDIPLGKIGINTHYKADLLRQWAETTPLSEKITIFNEELVLGTGGALKNAGEMLSRSVFIVHNADVISDIDINKLLEYHMVSENLVTLAVHYHPDFSNVWVDEKGQLRHVGNNYIGNSTGCIKKAFTGIAVYSPGFLEFLPEGRSGIVDAWLSAASAGSNIGTMDVTGCSWTDIGSPEAYYTAVLEALKKDGESVYIGPSVDCSNAVIGAWSVIEKESIIEGSASVSRSILLPGTRVHKEEILEDCITGPEFRLSISTALQDRKDMRQAPNILILNDIVTDLAKAALIGAGGSDRKYYRIPDRDKTIILMETSKSDPDYERHIAYTRFFRKKLLPVPELIAFDDENKQALFEDLGDVSLYSWLKCGKDPVQVEDIYKKVLDILIMIHTIRTEDSDECPLLQSRIFDHGHLRWETDYFAERYLRGVRGIEIQRTDPLIQEFEQLAARVDSFRKTFIHRDFQSQNIMVTDGGIPRLIDYQGARIGPPAYDLASILFDPYFRLDGAMRSRLIGYYVLKRNETDGADFNADEFRLSLLPCCLQRHMQALGAYGYLAMEKGKTYFLKHVPQALEYLAEEIRQVRYEYPVLYNQVMRLNEKA